MDREDVMVMYQYQPSTRVIIAMVESDLGLKEVFKKPPMALVTGPDGKSGPNLENAVVGALFNGLASVIMCQASSWLSLRNLGSRRGIPNTEYCPIIDL